MPHPVSTGPVLGLESSAAACSAAVLSETRLFARRFRPMKHGHAEALLPMVRAVMAEAGLGFGDLAGLAVTVGPGSFTGLRVGLAAARGLALASGLPVAGVTSFAAIARAVPAERRAGRILLVAIDTRRRDLYVEAQAPDGAILLAPRVCRPEELHQLLPAGGIALAGDGAALAAPALAAAGRSVETVDAGPPDALHVAALGIEHPPAAGPPPRPLYLRGVEATLPATGRPQ